MKSLRQKEICNFSERLNCNYDIFEMIFKKITIFVILLGIFQVFFFCLLDFFEISSFFKLIDKPVLEKPANDTDYSKLAQEALGILHR